MPLAPGTSVLHYRIVRPIGSGGMGVVYEADDTRLGRRVALKFLPADFSRDRPALERFQREARAASALNHPNICTIHAIEEADGTPFIAMELLEGESLDRRIADRPLAWDALVDTATQIAEALDAAHRRGIIHRDIKPANIFVTTDGRAKILDFGIAKIGGSAAEQVETVAMNTVRQPLTGEGVTVGTVAYMSPEQARGEELDARSDLFSLGAVLYEMSTGRRAFEGNTSGVVFQKILDASAPPEPRSLNPTLPFALEQIIVKALEKDRDLRYQTAADLRADLKRLKRDADIRPSRVRCRDGEPQSRRADLERRGPARRSAPAQGSHRCRGSSAHWSRRGRGLRRLFSRPDTETRCARGRSRAEDDRHAADDQR